MAEKLWDMANYTAGFAVAQSIATAFAIAKYEMKALKGMAEHIAGIVATLVFNVFYLVIIIWCGCKGATFDLECRDGSIWLMVTLGRVAAVLLFTVVVVMAFVGNLKDALKNRTR